MSPGPAHDPKQKVNLLHAADSNHRLKIPEHFHNGAKFNYFIIKSGPGQLRRVS